MLGLASRVTPWPLPLRIWLTAGEDGNGKLGTLILKMWTDIVQVAVDCMADLLVVDLCTSPSLESKRHQ